MIGYGISFVVGAVLGAAGMFYFMKETYLDSVLEREAEETEKFTGSVGKERKGASSYETHHYTSVPFCSVDWDDDMVLPKPEEVKYGDF
jgi:hypothetical protein